MPLKLIKASEIIKSPFSLGRLKSKSLVYQIDRDSDLALDLISALTSIRREKPSGKLTIYLHLGGVMALEFEDTEHLKPPNNLPSN